MLDHCFSTAGPLLPHCCPTAAALLPHRCAPLLLPQVYARDQTEEKEMGLLLKREKDKKAAEAGKKRKADGG